MELVKKFELFPTEVMAFKGSEDIPVDKIIEDIDYAVENNLAIQSNNDVNNIKHQSYPIIFNHEETSWRKDKEHDGWKQIHQDFFSACELYIVNSTSLLGEDFFKQHTPAHTRGWFYKSDKETFAEQGNARHNHSPAFLSGVYYLKPNGGEGTSFQDPRTWVHNPKGADLQAAEGYWVIFPSSLIHETMGTTADDPRYVIACDLYVAGI